MEEEYVAPRKWARPSRPSGLLNEPTPTLIEAAHCENKRIINLILWRKNKTGTIESTIDLISIRIANEKNLKRVGKKYPFVVSGVRSGLGYLHHLHVFLSDCHGFLLPQSSFGVLFCKSSLGVLFCSGDSRGGTYRALNQNLKTHILIEIMTYKVIVF